MTEPSPPQSWWSSIREAIRGSEADLTAVSIRRAIFLLAVPTVLEMSMESLFAIVDIFFVSKLGSNAVATVGITESALAPLYAIAMGLAAAATATVARRIGEKDSEGAAKAAAHVIALAVICALFFGGLGAWNARGILVVMGAGTEVVEQGTPYVAVMLGGGVTIFLLFLMNAIFRAAGDAAVAMRSLWLATILNIALAPCLIFGLGPFPRCGLVGAAIATTVSRGVGVGYQLLVLRRKKDRLAIGLRHFTLHKPLLKTLVGIASPATLQMLIETASWLGLVRIMASYGSVALAGYTVTMRVVIFVLLPSWGLAMAAATLVGQNLGAKAPDRAARSVWTIAGYNLAFLAPTSMVLAFAPTFFLRILTDDAATVAAASTGLRIIAIGLVSFSCGMVAIQAFNGAGDTRTPLFVNVASFWLFKLPLAWLLAKGLGFGPRGVFIAISLAYAMQSLLGGLLFLRGRWKTISIPAT